MIDLNGIEILHKRSLKSNILSESEMGTRERKVLNIFIKLESSIRTLHDILPLKKDLFEKNKMEVLEEIS